MLRGLSDQAWQVRRKTGELFAAMGRRAQPFLCQALTHTSPRARLQAAEGLSNAGKPTKKTLRALKRAFKDREPGVRMAVMKVIKQYTPQTFLPLLPTCLEDKYWLARARCADAIGAYKRRAAALIPHLIRQSRHNKEHIRFSVLRALGAIASQPKRSLPALIVGLADTQWRVRWAAATGIGVFRKKARRAVRPLLRAFRDAKRKIRGPAAISLGQIGRRATRALPFIIAPLQKDKTMAHISSKLSSSFQRAMLAFQLRPKEKHLLYLFSLTRAVAEYGKLAVPLLRKRTFRGKGMPRMWLLFCLGRIGPAARRATPQVRRLLTHPKQEVRWIASLVLARIAPRKQSTIRALKRLKADKSEWVQAAAKQALFHAELPYANPKVKRLPQAEQAAAQFLYVMRSKDTSPTLLWQ
tara:strand:+ start:5036 stop:6271 length:1236 start_codon:yes stop_codon:yes gene_type:complete